jgi:hypothetical protein
MKMVLLSGLLLVSAAASGIEKGSPRAAVLAELGEPNGSMRRNGKEILLFKTGTVTLQNNIVSEIDLSQEYAQKAAERELKAKEIRAAELAELEKQKQLYPEDHVIQIGCEYSKTENWEALPEFIRPASGKYRYNIYIPQGYHESDGRYYPALFLESPALWDSVKERVRKEKWIVIILPDATGPQIGKTMNGSFLAAYDDATARFRMARDYRFIAGRVPSAIFSTMRPVAGIILQEPDFSGLQKTGIQPDFLGKNPTLRAYVLLGNQDRAKLDWQAQFVIAHIPKSYIGVYEGSTAVLPESFASNAIDWMKKEYALP